MAIATAGIKQDYTLDVFINLYIARPYVSMHKDRLNIPASGLERSQEPGNHLVKELVGNHIHFRVRTQDVFCPMEIRAKLA